MKRTFITTLLIFIAIVGFSQQDQEAKSILENVTKTTQSYSSIQASFNYTLVNEEEGIYDENNGTILMKGNKYHLQLPLLGLEIFCDGTNVWTYMADAMEVNVTEIDEESDELMDPSKLFTIYEHGFDYQYVEETTVDGKDVYIIDLIPTTANIDYTKIRIQVDKDSMMINRAEMISDNGTNYVFDITDLKTNVPADDSNFTFNTANHPDVDVIDLR